MFGKNQRISQMQIGRMLALQLLGTGMFLPSLLSGLNLAQGLACIIAGAAVTAILCLGLKTNIHHMAAGRLIYGIYLFVLAGIVFCKMIEILQIIFLPQISMVFLTVILALTVLYAIWNGVEAQIRIFDVWFWFCVIFVCFVLIVWILSIVRNDWQPVLQIPSFAGFRENGQTNHAGGIKGVILGCLYSFFVFLPLLQCAELNHYKNIRKRTRKSLLFILILTAGAVAVIYTFLQLGYGRELIREMFFPYLVFVSDVSVLKKGLAFIVGAWLSSLFCILVAAAGYGARCFSGKAGENTVQVKTDSKTENKTGNEKKKQKKAAITATVILTVLGSVFYAYEWNYSDWADASGVLQMRQNGWQPGNREVENQVYPIAVGFDLAEDKTWNITFCFAQGKGNGDKEEEQDPEELLFSIEADSIADAEEKLKEEEKGNLNTMHIQTIVLSEELLQNSESMRLLCKDWLSLRMRTGSALCFQSPQVEEDLQALQEKLPTYSSWKKLASSQREENGGKKITFSQVMIWWNYSTDKDGILKFVPEIKGMQ